jgi:RNA polymerase sigma factor (sigma-70 family)
MPTSLSRDLSCGLEERVVALAQSGNRDAFGELVRRHHTASKRLAVAIVSNPVVAEDAVSQAWYKAYVHLDQFSGDHFATWFKRIVINECYQHLRSTARSRQVSLDDGTNTIQIESLTAAGMDPEVQAGSAEMVGLLRREIERLPEKLRVPLMMSLHQRPVVEIGEELGITLTATKSRLFRARDHLRRRVMRHFPGRVRRAPKE